MAKKAGKTPPSRAAARPRGARVQEGLSNPDESKKWNFRLYVAGKSPRSQAALENLRRLCEEHLVGEYHIEVVDLLENPHLAKADQILAIPTLVRKLPEPVRRVIGDLSKADRALVALEI